MADIAGEIARLVEDERAALASLSADDLEACLARKIALAGRLAELPPHRLPEIARMLGRHEMRLAATAAGLRGALQRIGELGAGGADLRTYARDGGAEVIARPVARLSRNA